MFRAIYLSYEDTGPVMRELLSPTYLFTIFGVGLFKDLSEESTPTVLPYIVASTEIFT